MKRSNKPWHPLPTAQVTWSTNKIPSSEIFDDVYYSPEKGMAESQTVFISGNSLPRRWSSHRHAAFRIAETGFGTGLNFLLTWQAWLDQPLPRPRLHFLSVEKHPLAKSDLCKALGNWPSLSTLSRELIHNYPHPIPGQHRIIFEGGSVILDLWWEEAEDALAELACTHGSTIDCWYLDGFTPKRNPAMWTNKLFHSIAACSRVNATFATFTAASDVRRGLQEAGFDVERLPGFGKKRERLCGKLTSPAAPPIEAGIDTPWDISSAARATPGTALVIGAGIAGCTIAASLARRNIRVLVLEAEQVAGAGSGNDQGVLYTRLSRRHSPLSDFSLHSFLFANRFYRQLFSSGQLCENKDGDLCGSFHQSSNIEDMATLKKLLQDVPELAQILDSSEANALLGIEQESAGYWYPDSGWIHPVSVCKALLQHPNIELKEHSGTISLTQQDNGWAAHSQGKLLAQAQCAIVAAGTSSGLIAGMDWLPLQAIRGQTTSLPTNSDFSRLRAALCHTGYISPQRAGSHCIGATFDIDDSNSTTTAADHRKNLDALASAVPHWQPTLSKLDEQQLQGRVAYRCASPDYLPLIGPVPDRAAFLADYAILRKNARKLVPTAGSYTAGLYLSTAHGSRGLTSAPLGAEVLASLICKEPLPLSRELYRAIAPSRFLIRALKRKQI